MVRLRRGFRTQTCPCASSRVARCRSRCWSFWPPPSCSAFPARPSPAARRRAGQPRWRPLRWPSYSAPSPPPPPRRRHLSVKMPTVDPALLRSQPRADGAPEHRGDIHVIVYGAGAQAALASVSAPDTVGSPLIDAVPGSIPASRARRSRPCVRRHLCRRRLADEADSDSATATPTAATLFRHERATASRGCPRRRGRRDDGFLLSSSADAFGLGDRPYRSGRTVAAAMEELRATRRDAVLPAGDRGVLPRRADSGRCGEAAA